MSIRVGDTVTRKSYGNDIVFMVLSINKEKKTATLQGLDVRLVADAPLDDVIKINSERLRLEKEKSDSRNRESLRLIQQERRLMREKNHWLQAGYVSREEDEQSLSFEIPGSVLHLDGDSRYLERCLSVYQELGVPVKGVHMVESEMPRQIGKLLKQHQPSALVITGHDAYRKQAGGEEDSLDSYRNSRHFVQAVIEARNYEPDKDRLIIFAGACQSKFESLLKAGANFASSPKRINIHTLDPVYIVEKVAFTSIRETINVFELAKNTITGIDGLGGIETFGTFRLGLPITDHMRKQNR
ncbi:sporulation peptidase YabG [Ammoniphilus oxalaticus]|uniref:Sporulation peptidase YabG n=1 Tax=Ammoniphilus oxalaticus TaxID=66863 RepID=A0A419SGA1_9BACL|nr:sporulation peptidase YabG [Ammoniphilus oxalaticus]RKD22808.1 sporulation peptidase YabG [Ammoniphilus oxalaticus]